MKPLAHRIPVAATLILLLALWPFPGAAETPASTPEAAGPHMLWRVTSDDGGTAYLMGSIHVAREDLFPLARVYDRAFEEAEIVVFEVDLEKILSMAFSMLRRGFFWDGRTLESELSEETWRRLQQQARSQGLDLSLFRRAKPWLVSLVLSASAMEQEGYSGAAGIDQVLSDRARRAGKPRRFLETADDQFLLFDDFSKREQEILLLSSLDEAEAGTGEVDEITEAWKRGDAEALDEQLRETGSAVPGFLDRLLTRRNRAWVPKIEGWLTEGETFLVIVGAGHLVGEDSVVDLLREKGYRVDRL